MRALEIIVGLIVAAILFVVLKVIGIVIKFALIAAAIGFIVGAAITMMFRSRSSEHGLVGLWVRDAHRPRRSGQMGFAKPHPILPRQAS
jgi:uncharacterized protein YacL